MTQQQKIFAHLQSQSITGLEAWKQYGVYRLSSLINRLRKTHNIKTEMVTEGETQFAKYTLIKSA
jgi:hypothetical protein